MDSIVRLKEYISRLKGTCIEKNIVLAVNLEKLVLSYLSSKSTSLHNDIENKSKVYLEPYNEKYEEINAVNFDAYKNRQEGFNGWEDFENIDENILNEKVNESFQNNKTQKNGEMQVLNNTDGSGKDEPRCEESSPSNLVAYNSREDWFGTWEEFTDETYQKSNIGEITSENYDNITSVKHKSDEEYFQIENNFTPKVYDECAPTNLEAFSNRDDGFMGWEEFEDKDKPHSNNQCVQDLTDDNAENKCATSSGVENCVDSRKHLIVEDKREDNNLEDEKEESIISENSLHNMKVKFLQEKQ